MGKPKPGKNMQFDPIEMIEKSAEMNRIDQTNPYGTSKYRTNPATGQTEYTTEFSPELQKIHSMQMNTAMEGSIRDPLAHLGSQAGGGMGELMSAMFGKVKNRYMGEEGTDSSRSNNMFKGGNKTTPPDTLSKTQPIPEPSPEQSNLVLSDAERARQAQMAAAMAGGGGGGGGGGSNVPRSQY